jgi:hypothetical protein
MSNAEPMSAHQRSENYRIQNGQRPGKRRVKLTPRQYKRFAKKFQRALHEAYEYRQATQ